MLLVFFSLTQQSFNLAVAKYIVSQNHETNRLDYKRSSLYLFMVQISMSYFKVSKQTPIRLLFLQLHGKESGYSERSTENERKLFQEPKLKLFLEHTKSEYVFYLHTGYTL